MLTHTGSQPKRPWDDERYHRHPGTGHDVQRAIDPERRRASAPRPHTTTSTNHMLPPIITGTEPFPPRTRSDWFPAASTSQGSPHRSVQGLAAQEGSCKRARLYSGSPFPPDPSRGQPAAHRIPPSLPGLGQDARDQQYWSQGMSSRPESLHTPVEVCQTCNDSKALVEKVVSGLEQLETELKHALASTPTARDTQVEKRNSTGGPNVEIVGLRDSLIWTSGSVHSSTRLVRELAATQRALPRISVANLGAPPAYEQPGAITSAPPDFFRGFMDKHERERLKDGHQRHAPDSTQLPPSPHPSVSSVSMYGSTQSPMGMSGSALMLPSPSSLHTPSTVPSTHSSYSPNSSQSAHGSYLQDLQCQVSTKSLALTTLQREHDQLLAAYARSQGRCQTLDKKSQISDLEIDTLTEEKLRLQSQVEAFEVQVEDLVTARDEAQKQTTANGAQYMRIVNMSSKLQAQSAEEAQRYKVDRETWERDRENLQHRIEELQAGRSEAQNLDHGNTQAAKGPAAPDPDHILASATLDELRSKVVRLRDSLLSMECMFMNVRQGTEKVGHVIEECSVSREEKICAADTTAVTPKIGSEQPHPERSAPDSPEESKEQQQQQQEEEEEAEEGNEHSTASSDAGAHAVFQAAAWAEAGVKPEVEKAHDDDGNDDENGERRNEK